MSRAQKPLEAYPVVPEGEMPPAPPADVLPAEAGRTAEVPRVRPPREIATLDFLDPSSITHSFPLQHPFRLDGEVVDKIDVTRLPIAAVGEILGRQADAKDFDAFEFYAAMTGLPAPVLRGLMPDDGEELMNIADPFLPRIVREIFSGPTSAPGGGTPGS